MDCLLNKNQQLKQTKNTQHMPQPEDNMYPDLTFTPKNKDFVSANTPDLRKSNQQSINMSKQHEKDLYKIHKTN